MNVLEVKNLTKKYGNFKALDNLTFSIKEGEVFGLLGPNGAGKTTTISAITTLTEPSSGDISVLGRRVDKDNQISKNEIGVVPQELTQHNFFSVEEILRFYSSYYGLKYDKTYVEHLLDKLDLMKHKHKYVVHLSGGMKRRLSIVKALIHRPKLLLLDEPTAGVDVGLKHTLWAFIQELRDSGMAILLTTHYLEEAELLCDRVGIIKDGTIVNTSPTKDIIAKFGVKKVSITFSKKQQTPAPNSPYFDKEDGNTLYFTPPTSWDIGTLLTEFSLEPKYIQDINIQEPRLEEVFTKILSEEKTR